MVDDQNSLTLGAGGCMGWVLHPSLSTWQWLGWYSEASRSAPLVSKRADRDASSYHPNHCHTARGGSETHPKCPPAASCQHPVLIYFETLSLRQLTGAETPANNKMEMIITEVHIPCANVASHFIAILMAPDDNAITMLWNGFQHEIENMNNTNRSHFLISYNVSTCRTCFTVCVIIFIVRLWTKLMLMWTQVFLVKTAPYSFAQFCGDKQNSQ